MSVDLSEWDLCLSRYVDDRGRVDYRSWKAERIQPFRTWIHSLAQISLPPEPSTQVALWINLYNALTIYQVLHRYPIASIRPQVLGMPNWLSFLRFFKRPVAQIGGGVYSLDQIEHGVLRGQFKEYRVHFALVCASLGCPLLRNQAYRPEQIESQLDDDISRFVLNPDKVRYDPEADVLYCSQLFKWYRQDFLRVADSIQEFISTYLPVQDQQYTQVTSQTSISYLPYDWSLNQRTSS